MTDLENRVEKIEWRVSTLEVAVEKLSVKVDVLSDKIDNFIAESRRTADRQDARMQQLENHLDLMSQKMDGT